MVGNARVRPRAMVELEGWQRKATFAMGREGLWRWTKVGKRGLRLGKRGFR